MLKFAATFLPLSNLVRVDFESRLAFLSGLLDHRRSTGPVVPLGFLLRMSKYSGSSAPGWNKFGWLFSVYKSKDLTSAKPDWCLSLLWTWSMPRQCRTTSSVHTDKWAANFGYCKKLSDSNLSLHGLQAKPLQCLSCVVGMLQKRSVLFCLRWTCSCQAAVSGVLTLGVINVNPSGNSHVICSALLRVSGYRIYLATPQQGRNSWCSSELCIA